MGPPPARPPASLFAIDTEAGKRIPTRPRRLEIFAEDLAPDADRGTIRDPRRVNDPSPAPPNGGNLAGLYPVGIPTIYHVNTR